MFPLSVSSDKQNYIQLLFQIFSDHDIPFIVGKGFDLNIDSRELIANLSHDIE
ncbi:hypothetical protein DSO57_1023085 [Entomophthora muscae]|uniref:Uncharacterized protein n=1 Tax=Entomophthora muscae TaxID=34485 RepID=A0ACC2TQ45_9FUNG|nr:hypothetical protein DSO57_1023085 [Entomophthora muscae]